MENFWDYNVWEWIFIFAVLLGSLLAGNIIKKSIPVLRDSLIPTSVLGGAILLIVGYVYKTVFGVSMLEQGDVVLAIFGDEARSKFEMITYHTLALGFIASTLKTTGGKLTKKRQTEIFNTGLTTVSTYLLQGVVGFGITLVAALIIPGFFSAAGVLLPFGYGQGTGQAMNYGSIYETQFGFVGGKSFGLTVAALGFISASIGGVLHLNIMKKKGKLKLSERNDGSLHTDSIESDNEIPMQESVDKMTVQIALIFLAYMIAYVLMWVISLIVPSMKAVIYGFNFLLGVISAILVKSLLGLFQKKGIIKKKYTNNFLMTRLSNFFFDLMIVSGIAAISLDTLEDYWGILIILGVAGAVITYAYNRFVAKKLFPDYYEEQFLTMYGMLTGTASTGVILLREIDKDFKTPASDNLVYQNLPAIVFGFPIMFLATLAPKKPLLSFIIFFALLVIMNIILFRAQIFGAIRKKSKKDK